MTVDVIETPEGFRMEWVKASRFAWALALSVAMIPRIGRAHDLGVLGSTWPIKESSLLTMMISRAADVDWQQVNKNLVKKAEEKIHHYPEDGLSASDKTETRYVDPTLVLQQDVKAPMKQKDGTRVWKVLFHKGTRVNPLSALRPVTRLLVFDPAKPEQLAFAEAARKAWPERIELVATGGDVASLSKRINKPVFYASQQIIAGFHLEHTPTLIGVGTGAHRTDLALTTFGPDSLAPDKAGETVENAWYGLGAPMNLEPPLAAAQN